MERYFKNLDLLLKNVKDPLEAGSIVSEYMRKKGSRVIPMYAMPQSDIQFMMQRKRGKRKVIFNGKKLRVEEERGEERYVSYCEGCRVIAEPSFIIWWYYFKFDNEIHTVAYEWR